MPEAASWNDPAGGTGARHRSGGKRDERRLPGRHSRRQGGRCANHLAQRRPLRAVSESRRGRHHAGRDGAITARCGGVADGAGALAFSPARVLVGPPSGGSMSFAHEYLADSLQVIEKLDRDQIEKMASLLADVRARGGRLFILGVGGSAANASHAVNDFRKICGIEAYAPTDNVSELTARTNDDGWTTVFVEWLKGSRLTAKDALLVFSVGGGNVEKNVSPNLVSALQLAKERGASVLGIVGRDGGYTAQVADVCIIIPTVNPMNTTPHAEAFQAVLWHLLVSHPALKTAQTKWE